MTTASATTVPTRASGGLSWAWRRELDHYPKPSVKYFYLVLVVVSGIMVYFEDYAAGGVAPILLPSLHMSLSFYSYLIVVFGVVGGAASYFGSFADRFGRANIVVFVGILLGLITAFGIPTAHSSWSFAVWYCVLGLGDGVIFVAGPALVRDFTPQVGRATAMGAVTLGAVAGSLVTSFAATRVINAFHDWQAIFIVAGLAGVGISLLCLVFLKELKPELRSQMVVTVREEQLAEIRAEVRPSADEVTVAKGRWRQLFQVKILGSAIAIGLFLVIYITAVGYFTLYFTEILKFPVAKANNLNTVYWGVNCVTLLLFGILSDLAKVRKPFMVLGTVGALIATVVLMNEHHPTYGALAVTLAFLAGFLGCGFAPWFASFTETIESINPALVATGLAFYGFGARSVGAIQGLVIPHIIGSPLGTASGWHTWFYVCIGGLVAFLPFTLVMTGHWSPRKAAAELRRHDEQVDAALRSRQSAGAATGVPARTGDRTRPGTT
jgi:MFS family permease